MYISVPAGKLRNRGSTSGGVDSSLVQIARTSASETDHSPLPSKGKCRPRTGHEGPEREWRYSSTFSLTSTLDGGGSS